MGCSSCGNGNGTVPGCRGNGSCTNGGCNRLNTFDWLSKLDLPDDEFQFLEISFKHGARKDFYYRNPRVQVDTGDLVVVGAQNGYDVGTVSLTGELVRLQMKKKKVREDRIHYGVMRQARDRDILRLEEARKLEYQTMVRARAIVRTLGLEMKIGDVEYQGDKRKATFYYTADGRVDFRELVRHYAKEFRVKIEMRQIGARQESSRIGGIGSCGRELCCSTWLTDFKSVTTTAARYQNLAINQAKLSGQCGRLKCCLNYELDTYLEALEDFPNNADMLKTKKGEAQLVKTDIFKGQMYYSIPGETGIVPLEVDQVVRILEMNADGKIPDDLRKFRTIPDASSMEIDYGDDTEEFELKTKKKSKRRKGRRRPSRKQAKKAK
jgi:cell fate regulator YaaT (PSP1 superfamily)